MVLLEQRTFNYIDDRGNRTFGSENSSNTPLEDKFLNSILFPFLDRPTFDERDSTEQLEEVYLEGRKKERIPKKSYWISSPYLLHTRNIPCIDERIKVIEVVC